MAPFSQLPAETITGLGWAISELLSSINTIVEQTKRSKQCVHLKAMTHKMNSRSSSGNGLRGLWLQILMIHSRHSGFGDKLETSLKITQHFLIVHELIKATFEDFYIFSFDYSLRQVIPDINDSMRETITPISKRAPFMKILMECPLVTPFFLERIRFWACIWVVLSLWESWIFLSNHPGAFYIIKSVIYVSWSFPHMLSPWNLVWVWLPVSGRFQLLPLGV